MPPDFRSPNPVDPFPSDTWNGYGSVRHYPGTGESFAANGYVELTPQGAASTRVALYQCEVSPTTTSVEYAPDTLYTSGNAFISTDENCENPPGGDQIRNIGLVGYALDYSATGTTPLYRCYYAPFNSYFLTMSTGCDDGFGTESVLLGYVWTSMGTSHGVRESVSALNRRSYLATQRALLPHGAPRLMSARARSLGASIERLVRGRRVRRLRACSSRCRSRTPLPYSIDGRGIRVVR